MKSIFLIGFLLASLQANAQSGAEKELFDKLVAKGVPARGLKKILDFRAQSMGAKIVHDIYTCAGLEATDEKPCIESERSRSTRTLRIQPHDYAVVIDFKKSSLAKRFFLINLKTAEVETYRVTHGKGSGEGAYAYRFSNTKDSKQTSLGLYVSGGTYKGKYGTTLRLYGLEKSNDQAYNRDIVLHGADYAADDFPNRINPKTKKPFGRLGISWGCPALSFKIARRLIPILEGGALIYHDHADLAEEALSGREVVGPNPEAD